MGGRSSVGKGQASQFQLLTFARSVPSRPDSHLPRSERGGWCVAGGAPAESRKKNLKRDPGLMSNQAEGSATTFPVRLEFLYGCLQRK